MTTVPAAASTRMRIPGAMRWAARVAAVERREMKLGCRGAELGEREEEHVVRRVEHAGADERSADVEEERAHTREHADHVKLRRLANSGETPHAIQSEAHDEAP